MKHSFPLILAAFALMLTACNNNPKENKLNVDWDSPLYEVDQDGDTISKWTYQEWEEGRNIIKEDLPSEDNLEGSTTDYYDLDNRLAATETWINSGSDHYMGLDFEYNGKVRIGEGNETIDGAPSFYYIKQITYFLDDECRYDTLTQEFVEEIFWEDIEEDQMEQYEEESEIPMTSYTRKRYEATPTGYRLVEIVSYATDLIDLEDIDIQFSYKESYEYDTEGRLAKKILSFGEDWPNTITTYTYVDNKRIERIDDTETTTYYKINE